VDILPVRILLIENASITESMKASPMKKPPGLFVPSGHPELSHRRPMQMERFLFGVCYYPEHWNELTRVHDAARMASAGINVVRMAEFAWDLIEKTEAKFDFSLFDKTIAHLAGHGISTILCTPTAAPPRWLTQRHPEILRRNENQVALQHGSRQHASYAHPLFRDYSRKITRAMAKHYKANPDVIGWQTDNEIYCHFADDHGPEMQVAFREFLIRKYANNIDNLNTAWGTAFWTQTYSGFDQIETPVSGRPTYPNPSQMLDYARFMSDVVENFQHDQVEILRTENSRWFVFHNGIMRRTDYRGPFSMDLDFLGFDVYPFFQSDPHERSHSQAFNADRARSYAGNFVVPEHQSGFGSQADYAHPVPEPDEMRKGTYASLARGADAILYFRWRTCRFGAEIHWTGILDHDNVPRRRYEELARIGKEIRVLGPELLGTSVFCDVAIATGDYDVREAHSTYPMGLPSDQQIAEAAHRSFWKSGFAVGCVHPEDDLTGVKLYIIPHWVCFDPEWVKPLTAFVEAGGTLVIGARTGGRNFDNQVVAETLPGCLRELVGATVEEYGKESANSARPKHLKLGDKEVPLAHWYEWLNSDTGTKILAKWKGRHLEGKAGITMKIREKGRVIYVGTYLDEPVTDALMPLFAKLAGLKPLLPGAPPGVEIVRREAPGRALWFLLNHTDQPVIIRNPPEGRELLTGKMLGSKKLRLPTHGVAVIRHSMEESAKPRKNKKANRKVVATRPIQLQKGS